MAVETEQRANVSWEEDPTTCPLDTTPPPCRPPVAELNTEELQSYCAAHVLLNICSRQLVNMRTLSGECSYIQRKLSFMRYSVHVGCYEATSKVHEFIEATSDKFVVECELVIQDSCKVNGLILGDWYCRSLSPP